MTLDINLLVNILEIHGTSRMDAPPDDRVVNRVHPLHRLSVEGQKEVYGGQEGLPPSKVKRYAQTHVVSKDKRDRLKNLRL